MSYESYFSVPSGTQDFSAVVVHVVIPFFPGSTACVGGMAEPSLSPAYYYRWKQNGPKGS